MIFISTRGKRRKLSSRLETTSSAINFTSTRQNFFYSVFLARLKISSSQFSLCYHLRDRQLASPVVLLLRIRSVLGAQPRNFWFDEIRYFILHFTPGSHLNSGFASCVRLSSEKPQSVSAIKRDVDDVSLGVSLKIKIRDFSCGFLLLLLYHKRLCGSLNCLAHK
jgi:hypothetical protein